MNLNFTKNVVRSGLHNIMGSVRSRVLCCAVGIFLLSHSIFLVGISSPAKLYWDEFYYIPAASKIMKHEITNLEHPPLAKLLMAASITFWGNNSFGWRYMSALFGALALTGMYLWAFNLFMNEKAALWAAAITLVNQFLYVQSRIAMLDIFAFAFMVWALALFTATWHTTHCKRMFYVIGVLLGLAVASKWSGLLAVLMITGIVTIVKILQNWGIGFENPRETDWYRPDLWRDMTIYDWIANLVLNPVAVYLITFAPILGADPIALFQLQKQIWYNHWHLTTPHPYMSNWIGWAVVRRPILYLFDRDPKNPNSLEVVLFLGNPVVLWSGVVAVLVCIYGWLKARRRDAFIISVSWICFYLVWGLVSRSVFYYYYFPAGMVLSLALTYLFYKTAIVRSAAARHLFLCIASGVFIYFFPITSAITGVTTPGYNQRMWFDTWSMEQKWSPRGGPGN